MYEFTDISNKKLLAFVFRVINNGFIGSELKQPCRTDANTIFSKIEKLFSENDIPEIIL